MKVPKAPLKSKPNLGVLICPAPSARATRRNSSLGSTRQGVDQPFIAILKAIDSECRRSPDGDREFRDTRRSGNDALFEMPRRKR